MKKTLIKIKATLSTILSTLADCIIPTLPIMIGVGMMKVLLIILGPLVFNILSEESNTYIVLSFVADAGYYFMPIYTAIASAEKFNTNKYIAALSGAMLLSPTYISLSSAQKQLSIFGLPIVSTDYSNQVIPSVIVVWILSIIYNFLDSKIKSNLKPIIVPLSTIILIVPISFCIIGPVGVYFGNLLVKLILFLKSIGPLGNAIMCAIIPYITIAGLGGANLSTMLLLASSGCDPILFFANVLYNNILGFVTLALFMKNKKSETLAAAITSAIAGTSEPALFGIVIKDPIALLCLTISNFCAGLYVGITGVKSYAMASFGIFGLITTIGPDSSIINAIIALIIGCSIGFISCYFTHKNNMQN